MAHVGVDGNSPSALIVLRGLAKTYHRGSEAVHVLQGVDLTIDKGDFVRPRTGRPGCSDEASGPGD